MFTPDFQEEAEILKKELAAAVNRNRELFRLRPDRLALNVEANKMEQRIELLQKIIEEKPISVKEYWQLSLYETRFVKKHQKFLYSLTEADRLVQDLHQATKELAQIDVKNPPPPQQPSGHANSMVFFPDCTSPDVHRMREWHAAQRRDKRERNVLAVRQQEDVKGRALRKTR